MIPRTVVHHREAVDIGFLRDGAGFVCGRRMDGGRKKSTQQHAEREVG